MLFSSKWMGTSTTTAWWIMMMTFSSSSKSMIQKQQPKIAIIGSGAAGLAAARIFQRSTANVDITVLEKESTVGGVWNYRAGDLSKPMYKGLRTNLPKEIMAFREFPWPSMEQSFLTHQQVHEYLCEYSHRYHLTEFIHTNCCVEQLTCLPDQTSCFSPDNGKEKWPKIRLQWSQTVEGSTALQHHDVFDAVLVCNGHYSLPRIPDVPGLNEYFQGKTMHSIEYDVPENFVGQRVLCVGGRASGSDIAREIASQPGDSGTTVIYVSDSSFDTQIPPIQERNVINTSRTIKVLPDGRVSFQGDKTEPAAFDTIIFCSGYDYQFPFINQASRLVWDARSRRCTPLLDQLWHAVYPNIAFLGIVHSVLPFPLFELQAQAVERSLREPLLLLPSLEARQQHAAEAAVSGGPEHGRVPDDTHFLGDAQWGYCRHMAQYAGCLDEEMEEYLNINKAIYDHSGLERKKANPGGPDEYRETVYSRGSGESSLFCVKHLHSLRDYPAQIT